MWCRALKTGVTHCWRVRGKVLSGLGAAWDWYATFAGIAGVDPTDHRAAAAGLPPIDSVNLWPYLSGMDPTPPRTVLPIGSSEPGHIWGGGLTRVTGVISDEGEHVWKLLTGDVPMDTWSGVQSPNASMTRDPTMIVQHCGSGCLYDLANDQGEHTDLASANPDVVAKLTHVLVGFNQTCFSPSRGKVSAEACQYLEGTYGGWFGPFVGV